MLAATVGSVRVICAYVPNGESVASDKYQYKLRWLDAFRGWLKHELARHPRLADRMLPARSMLRRIVS